MHQVKGRFLIVLAKYSCPELAHFTLLVRSTGHFFYLWVGFLPVLGRVNVVLLAHVVDRQRTAQESTQPDVLRHVSCIRIAILN